MASIKLTELRPVGSELFHDSESFINELNDHEMPTSITGAGSSSHGGWSSSMSSGFSSGWGSSGLSVSGSTFSSSSTSY
jgi:hypothetical protein